MSLLLQAGWTAPDGALQGSTSWLQAVVDGLCELSSRDALTGLNNRRQFESAIAREVDRVARYGGEEFCVLLPHTEHEGALQAAERLRAAVHAREITWHDETLGVTISTGVACATDPTEPMDALLRRADEALYRAKAQGRNRVEVATPLAA